MDIPERAIHLRHAHVDQRFDPGIQKSAVAIILYFLNRTDAPLQFNIRNVEVNGRTETRFDVMGAVLDAHKEIDFLIPHHVIDGWNSGEPTVVTFAFELLYGEPNRPFARILTKQAVVEISGPNNVEITYELDTDAPIER